MSEFSQLSKEEQEAILRMRKKMTKTKESKIVDDSPKESDNALVEICKYVAGKGGKEKCVDHSATPYGFCKKHSRTVQAKKAREEYECTTATCSTTPSIDSSPEIPEKVKPVAKDSGKKVASKQAVDEEPPKKTTKQVAPVKEEIKKPTKQPAPVKEETPKKITKQTNGKPQPLHKEVIRSKKIHPNHWGRFEDPVTHIVFDKNTKEAYGIQEPSGKVSALKQEHVQICIRNKWNYNLPYASDDEESESIHDSDFDEDDDEEISESEEESLESSSLEDDEEGEDVDELAESDENSGDDSDEELVDSEEESDDDDSDEESDDGDSDEESDEDSDDSR